MDGDVARWVLEFLLREPVDDEVVKSMVRFVPLSDQPSSLTKTMLLRRIESEIATDSVSPKVLELLEYIEESDFRDGAAPSASMKAAYCAVAVDCTVRFLEERDDREAKYFEAVKIIWRGSVLGMERSEECGLVSDELWRWRDDIERAVWDVSVRGSLIRRNRENDAVEAVGKYVAEEWETIGPSFLVLAREKLDDDAWEEIMGPADVPFRDQIGASIQDFLALIQDCAGIIQDCRKEVAKSNRVPRRKHVANKRSRGVKIVDTEDVDVGTSCNKYECPPTTEVDKVRVALKASSLELQAVVKDPLPDAMQFAETIASAMGRVNISHGPSVENQIRVDVDAVNPAADNGAEVVQDNVNNLETQCPRHQNKVPKLGIMNRNSTARTYEWNDSIDALPEESCRSRLQLPSPKGGRLVSPLKKYETVKFGKRRKKKKWSQVEEDTLRTGVQKYGKGNWKLILNSYRGVFEERTDGDLKDKWRNMTR